MYTLREALAALDVTPYSILRRNNDANTANTSVPMKPYPKKGVIGYIMGSCVPLLILCFLFCTSRSPSQISSTLSFDNFLYPDEDSNTLTADRRLRRSRLKDLLNINYIRTLVYANYIIGIVFCTTALIITCVGIHDFTDCRNAIYVCIGFLVASKALMQLFLAERAHVANINYVRRRDDPVWLFSVAAIVVLGLPVTVWTFLSPVVYIGKLDGRCRKGLPPKVVAPIQVCEILLNTILTIMFITILRRTRRCELFPTELIHEPRRLHRWYKLTRSKIMQIVRPGKEDVLSSMEPFNDELNRTDSVVLPPSTQPSRLHGLARKSLLGTLMILGWAVVNSTIFYVTRGREEAWLCYTQCTLDGTLSFVPLLSNPFMLVSTSP